MKSNSLKRNVSWAFLGNLTYAGCQWLMLVVLAKISSPKVVGQFALGLAVVAPVFVFTNMQLRGIQATDVREQYPFSDYFGFRLTSSSVALIVVFGVTFLSEYSFESIIVVLVLGVAKAVESLSDLSYGLLQKQEQMDKIALSMMLKGPLSLIAFILPNYLWGSLKLGCLFLAIVWFLVFYFFDRKNVLCVLNSNNKQLRFSPRFNFIKIKKIFLMALPLGFVVLLNSVNINLPKYTIVEYLGEEKLGYYSAIAYLLVVGSTVVNAVGQSATPRLAKYYQFDRSAYMKLLLKVFFIALFIGLSGIIISIIGGKYILSFIYTKEYGAYQNVFVWTMVGSCALYCSTMFGCGITAARCFLSQAVVGLAVTGTTVVAVLYMVPNRGLVGGAIALAIGFLVKLVGQGLQIAYLTKGKLGKGV